MAAQFLELKPSQLRKNPWNTNKVTPENERKIRASLKRNGVFKPIIVREIEEGVYEIIGGQHRWEQAIELGLDKLPVFNLGCIDDKRAKEISLADNARYGTDDTIELAELLKTLDTDELKDFLPYGESDINEIFSSNIALEELELEEDIETKLKTPDDLEPVAKPAKTHTIMRFKVPIADAERITALIATTQKEYGFTEADELTNVGDALVQILMPYLK